MKQKIYLAGGMKSNWQSRLKEIDGFVFYDPKDKEMLKELTLNEYGTWDLHYIRQSDIVFVYAERDNPSGIGLAVEAGYAKGLGKTVILVLEDDNRFHEDRYMQFLKKAANITFTNLQDGINYLKVYR